MLIFQLELVCTSSLIWGVHLGHADMSNAFLFFCNSSLHTLQSISWIRVGNCDSRHKITVKWLIFLFCIFEFLVSHPEMGYLDWRFSCPQSFWANSKIVPQIRPQLPPSVSIFFYLLTILLFYTIIWLLTESLNGP